MKHNKRIQQLFITIVGMVMLMSLPTNTEALLTSKTGFIYPSNSIYDGPYVGWTDWNWREQGHHLGVDFDHPKGAAVYAIADGKVVMSEGGYIRIRHQKSDGTYFTAIYGHIAGSVQEGATVKAGDVIGSVSDCWIGNENLTHLHFSIHRKEEANLDDSGSLSAAKTFNDPGYVYGCRDKAQAAVKANGLGFYDPLAFLENEFPLTAKDYPTLHVFPDENRLYQAMRGTNNGVYTRYKTQSGGWSPWAPGPAGALLARVVADATKPIIYVVRTKFPSGFRIEPHFHPDDRIVTVLSGMVSIGYGEQFDESKMRALSARSVWTEPANQPHFTWAKDGEAVIQTVGYGPSGTTPVKPRH